MKRLDLLLFGLVVALLASPTNSVGQSKRAKLPDFDKPYYQAQFLGLAQGGFQFWDKGYLITHAWDMTLEVNPRKPGVVLYGKDGGVAREAVVWIDGARSVSVADAAVSRSGKLVVAGGATGPDGAIANFIAEIGADDHVKRVIRTTPFMPVYVCASDDGTVWSYGVERDDHLVSVQNSLRLRQYSFKKGQLRAMLDTTSLNQGWLLERGVYPGQISLRCNSKTVVLYNAGTGDLLEFDLQTNALKATKIPPLVSGQNGVFVTGFALTESGEIFASLNDRSKKPFLSGLFRLSVNSTPGAKWVPVTGTLGPYLKGSPIERLIGADGDDLVYTARRDGNLFWSKQGGQ